MHLDSVLVPAGVFFVLATAFFLRVWFTTGKYAKPSRNKRDD